MVIVKNAGRMTAIFLEYDFKQGNLTCTAIGIYKHGRALFMNIEMLKNVVWKEENHENSSWQEKYASELEHENNI